MLQLDARFERQKTGWIAKAGGVAQAEAGRWAFRQVMGDGGH
jgi:hypothetical protein